MYFRIDHIYADKQAYEDDDTTPSQSTGANKYFHYVLRTNEYGSVSQSYQKKNWNKHPRPQLHFGQIANPNNTDRQSLVVTTTEYELKLKDLTNWNYNSSNIRSVDGKLDGFSMEYREWNPQTKQYDIKTKAFTGNGTVLGNAYIYGHIDQFERVEHKVVIDVGGDYMIGYGESKTIVCTLENGYGEDITHTVTAWRLTRSTGRTNEDAAWNNAHTSFDGTITLRWDDQVDDLGDGDDNVLSSLFTITATHDGGPTSETIEL